MKETALKRIIRAWTKASLIKRILIGMIFEFHWGYLSNLQESVCLGSLCRRTGHRSYSGFALVAQCPFPTPKGQNTNMRRLLFSYTCLERFAAALVAVLASFLLPVQITHDQRKLTVSVRSPQQPLAKLVDNPLNAIVEASYIGILSPGSRLWDGYERELVIQPGIAENHGGCHLIKSWNGSIKPSSLWDFRLGV